MAVELQSSTVAGGLRRLLASWLAAALALAPAAAGALAAAGCGGRGSGRPAESASGASDDADAAEWAWLEETKRRLDAGRARLARLEAAADAAGTADIANTADADTAAAAPSPADPAAAGPLRREVDLLTTEFARRLVDYINAHPPAEGETLGERQRAALRMKSDEEMVQARAYIERGGDYQRAIEIYEAALAVDPGNERIEQELARARQMRYMTPERFAQVKEGMSPAEVRKLLGQPNLHNVREYAERGVVAWFYPKDASGAAAAVWFHREKGEAAPTVYMADFEAVRTGAPEEQQAG